MSQQQAPHEGASDQVALHSTEPFAPTSTAANRRVKRKRRHVANPSGPNAGGDEGPLTVQQKLLRKDEIRSRKLAAKKGWLPTAKAASPTFSLVNPPDEWVGVRYDRAPSFLSSTHGKVFSGDVLPGGFVVTGGKPNGALEFRHPVTGTLERSLTGHHSDAVLAIACTPSGVFTAGADGRLIKWSPTDYGMEKQRHYEGIITTLVYAARLTHIGLFSAGDELVVRQWNINDFDTVSKLTGATTCVASLATDARYIYAACSEGFVCIFELLDRVMLFQVKAHDGDTWCVRCDEDHIFTAGDDACVKIWTSEGLRDETPLHVLKGHAGPVYSLLLYHNVLFSAGDDAVVLVWRLPASDEDVAVAALETETSMRVDPVEVLVPFAQTATAATTATTTSVVLGGRTSVEQRALLSQLVATKVTTSHGGAHEPYSGPDAGSDDDGSSVVRLTRRITCLALEGNELMAAGHDGHILKWYVEDLLPVTMDVMTDVPKLGGASDKEHEAFLKLPVEERHLRLQARESKRAISGYTELPINHVVEALLVKVRASWLNAELIPFILFITLYTIFVITDYSVIDVFNETYGIEQGIDTQSVGSFRTAFTFPDVFDNSIFQLFMANSLVNNMWAQHPNDAASPLSPFRFVGQNELASPVRFRTQRAKWRTCHVNARRFRDASQGRCYHYIGLYSNNQDDDPFYCTSSGCNATLKTLFNVSNGQFPFVRNAGGFIQTDLYYGPGGYVLDIPGNLGSAATQTRLNAIASSGFVDNTATRLLSIEYVSYNAALDVFTVNRMVIECLEGVTWRAHMFHIPFKIFSVSASAGRLVFESFFALFVVFWSVKFVTDGVRTYRLTGSFMYYALDTWTILEVANLVLFYIAFGVRWAWYSDSAAIQGSKRPFDTSVFSQEFETINTEYQLQLYINAFNVILTFLKILKFVQLNDKLNMLSRAIYLARSSIVGILFLFVYVVFAFALCAYTIYGNTLHSFCTLNGAYNSLLRLLVGDFDYDAMSDEAVGYTVAFHWSYVILSQFLLLNFLIAVLVDSFGEAVQQRLPVPLDEAIVRAAEQLAGEFSSRSIKVMLVLAFHRSSKTSLTAQYAASMRKYRWELLSEDAQNSLSYEELDRHYVTRDFFVNSAPELLRTSENLNFMDEVWYDLAWEYHYRLRDRQSKTNHEQEALVLSVLQGELGHVGRVISQFETQLRRFTALGASLQKIGAAPQGDASPRQDSTTSPPLRSVGEL